MMIYDNQYSQRDLPAWVGTAKLGKRQHHRLTTRCFLQENAKQQRNHARETSTVANSTRIFIRVVTTKHNEILISFALSCFRV